MNFRTFAVLFWACLLGTAAVAGEQNRTRIEIVVDDDASGQRSFSFDSQDAGFDLDGQHEIEMHLDAATRDRIREVLQSSSQQVEVLFIDGSEFDVDSDTHVHGAHEVRIIKKEVDVTN